MSETDLGEYDIQAEFRDRLRYSMLLEEKFKQLAQAIANPKTPFKIIQVILLDLLTDIPDSWKDQLFEDEMKKVIVTRTIDNRPKWGEVKLSMGYCEEMNIPITREVKEINYFRLKNAIVNLFDRRQLLIRRTKFEMTTGKNLRNPDLESLYDEEDNEDEN